MGEYQANIWHILITIAITAIAGHFRLHWGIIATLYVLIALEAFLVAYSGIAVNIEKIVFAKANFAKSIENLSDARLKMMGNYFPEIIVQYDPSTNRVQRVIEGVITESVFLKLMKRSTNTQLAPVREFPERGGEQQQVADFHRFCQSRGWAEEWAGNQTSQWRPGWTPRRLLMLYGYEDAVSIPNLTEQERAWDNPVRYNYEAT